MDKIKAKFKSNLAPKHYLAYCASFVGYGLLITSLGPLIPYFASLTGFTQTQYSFLFFWRSIGFIFGAITLRHLEKYLTFHSILMVSSAVLLILTTIFSTIIQTKHQAINIFFISTFSCYLQIVVNVCVLETQKHGEVEFWMLICHGMFGIGGLVGPFVVYVFQLKSYMVMGFFIVIIAPFYWFLKTPEDHKQIQEQVKKQGVIQQIKHCGHQGPYPAPHEQSPKLIKIPRQIISKKIQLLVSFMFFIYIGLEVGWGAWVSSYAVLQGIATKQQATSYTSIYWIAITAFRFVSPCWPFKSMQKMFILSYALVVSVVISLILLFLGYTSTACMFGSIIFGLCFSSMFPLLLAIPTQYNMDITSQQNGNCMVWVALGQGILSMMIGYFMAWFSNNMLYYMIALFAIIFLCATHFLRDFYQQQSPLFVKNSQNKNQKQLKQIMIPKN